MIETKTGWVVCVAAWFILAFVQVRGFECLRFDTCGANDLYSAMIIGAAMLVPAYIIGLVASAMTKAE